MILKPANIKDNSRRRYTGGGPRPDNTRLKQREALERQEAWAKLTPEQQLKALDFRPGKSLRQRARIQLLIEKRKFVSTKAHIEHFELPSKNSGERIKAKDRRAAERLKRNSK